MGYVVNIKEKALRDLHHNYGTKRHPLCATCKVKSAPREPGTCSISYAPKAWFTDGRNCPRLLKQERVMYPKLRRGTEG